MNIPEGFVLVPIELTAEMREAFHESYESYEDGMGECPDSQWEAMLMEALPPELPAYDEAKERELFMKKYPLPPNVQWSEEHKNFGWVRKDAFQRTITYRALYSGWKACAQSRDGSVSDE